MRTSDFVKVNIGNEKSEIKPIASLNNTSAVLILNLLSYDEYVSLRNNNGTIEDPIWETPQALIERFKLETDWQPYNPFDNDTQEVLGSILEDVANSYFTGGGLSLVTKVLTFISNEQEWIDEGFTPISIGSRTVIVADNIIGRNDVVGLPNDVINIQLAWNDSKVIELGTLANALDEEPFAERKILYITTNDKSDFIARDNVFIQYYENNAETGKAATENNYESAAAMAYFSKLNYWEDDIKDYEFTDWAGSDLSKLNIANNIPAHEVEVNIFTHLINRYFVTKGLLSSGMKLLTYYFEIIIAQKITTLLMMTLLRKVEMNPETYNGIYNDINTLLTAFANNNLFDRTYVNDKLRLIERENKSIKALEVDEKLITGFKVLVLPATRANKSSRIYDGVYIYFAINNQIREININGFGMGGI